MKVLIIFSIFLSVVTHAQTKKRIVPKLEAEITEVGDQAVLSNINFKTTQQQKLALGIGFFVTDSPLVTQPAARSVCKEFGYADADSADWETNVVEDKEIIYLADSRTLAVRAAYGKDIAQKSGDQQTVKYLVSVICRR